MSVQEVFVVILNGNIWFDGDVMKLWHVLAAESFVNFLTW